MKTKNVMQADAEVAGTSILSSDLTAPKYVNPAGDEYPVIAVNGYDYPSKLGVGEDEIIDQLETIRNCGFNATTWLCRGNSQIWRPYISTYLKVSASLGLRTIYMLQTMMPKVMQKSSDSSQEKDTTYDPTLEYIAEVLNLNKDDANLWGYKLCDEPSFNMWGYTTPTAAEGIRDLPAMYRTYLQNANGHVGYVTLSALVTPDNVGAEIDGSTDNNKRRYTSFLNAISKRLNPTLLTVDIYPVLKACNVKGDFIDLKGVLILARYYYILEAIGDFSRDSKIPFWMYMLSTQFIIYKDGSTEINAEYPLPTVGILLFQAMTALAYGFQGLVFWTYTMNKDQKQIDSTTGEEIPKEEYILAPYMDDDGSLSEIWGSCSTVINSIRLYGKILLGAEFIEARHVYGSAYKDDTFPWTIEFESYKGCVAYAVAYGRGFVITRLNKGSERYVAIVSHDPYDAQEITLTLCAGCRWTEYSMLDLGDSSLIETEHESKEYEESVSRMLRPGDIILIRYEWR